MELHVSLGGSSHLSADVYGQIKEAIVSGRLRHGDPLPATRELAARLSVSRNTILNAYRRLIAEGFLVARAGAGTFVDMDRAKETGSRRAPAVSPIQPRAIWKALAVEREARRSVPYDFQIGVLDPRLFPWDEWRSLVARQWRARRRAPGYPSPEGDPAARAAIARHVGVSRSVRAAADDVLVTSGAQQALDLVARVLVEPGMRVAVEDPGYPPMRRVLSALGAEIVPVRVDAEGIEVTALPDDVRLVYVTPSHQFPLGSAMSLARRMALLAWSERHGAAIVEDDYDSELRFDGRPLEPLQSLDRQGRVLYVGSFSKVLLPTLRLGFVVAPSSLMPALHAAKLTADSHGAVDAQRALAELMDDGLFARHVRRLTRVYRARRDALIGALDRHLGHALVRVPSSAGLHVAALFHDRETDVTEVVRRALDAGVAVQSLRPYYRLRPRAGIALGIGCIDAAKISEGIRRLARCIG